MNTSIPVITIDGPSGSGKSTLCIKLSKILKWNFLNSGYIYRLLALEILSNKIKLNNKKKIIFICNKLNISFILKKNKFCSFLNGIDVSNIIINEDIGQIASKISSYSYIRSHLLEKQRSFRTLPGLIAEGRDMGSKVFTDAKIKFFLKASLNKRILRKTKQLQKKGFNIKVKDMINNIKNRDYLDKNREISPLKKTKDSLVIDSSNLTINEMTFYAINYIKKFIYLPF